MEAPSGRQSGKPVRVLQIIHSPDPGGVLALAQSITAGVAEHGIMIDTLFLTPRPGMSAWAKIKGALVASSRILRGKYQAVVAYQAWPSIIVGFTGLIARGPRLIVHQTTIPTATSAPIRWLGGLLGSLGLYPVNVVNTVFTRDEFAAYPRSYRKHLKLIEHGVDRPVITCSRQATLQRYGIPDDRTILLNTARLVAEKNQDTIIRALPSLPDCRLVVAGDGALREDFLALAEKLGVADRVHLLGPLPRDQTIELYGAADLFVFPSFHETFGISAVEAVLLAVPTLVSDIAVLREVLTIDRRSPVAFIGVTDVPAWTEALRRWSNDPPPRADLEAFAAALARRYSEERMVDAYVALLKDPVG